MQAASVNTAYGARWQFSLGQLFYLVGLASLAIFVVAPVYHHALHLPRSTAVCIALAATAVGAAIGFFRAQAERTPREFFCGFVLLYALLAWNLLPLFWSLGIGWTLIVLAVSTPALTWTGVTTYRRGFGEFACEGRLLTSLLISWLLVTVGSAYFFVNYCCHRGCNANESAAIATCKTYAEAQDIYRRTDWDGDGVLEYSPTIKGANSLYEKTAGTGDLTLVDAAFANAAWGQNARPKAGYFVKVLTGQGPDAPGGRKNYLDEKGNLAQGYALVAWPAVYDGKGRNSFQINNTGTVYQMDLGPDTAALAEQMTEYNPAQGWVVAE